MNKQRMRETSLSLKCLVSLSSAPRLRKPNICKLSQSIAKNLMANFAIKYFSELKKYVLITTYMLGTMVVTIDNLVNTTRLLLASGDLVLRSHLIQRMPLRTDLFYFDHMSLNQNLSILSIELTSRFGLASYIIDGTCHITFL